MKLNKKVIDSITVCGLCAMLTVTAVTNSGRAGRNELSGELHVHPLPSSLGYFNIVHLSTNARDVRVRRSTHIIRIPQNYITRLVTVIHVSLIRCLSRTVITRPALNPQ